MLEPIAVENLGALSCSTLDFFVELGRRICSQSGDVSENSYLLQRISDAALQVGAFAFVVLTVDLPDFVKYLYHKYLNKYINALFPSFRTKLS